MIVTKNGKSRSIRTYEEYKRVVLRLRKSLDEEEVLLFNKAMEELVQYFKTDRYLDDYEIKMVVNKWLAKKVYRKGHVPVDPLKFLTDDNYLGKIGKTLYPKLVEDFVELFSGSYYKVMLLGSIGCGKSTFAYISMARVLYELSCMINPQKVCNVQEGSRLDLLAISVRVPLARKAVYKPVCDLLEMSPYFQAEFRPDITQDECRLPRDIYFQPVANDTVNVLSLNVFGGIIDEVNFMDTPHNRVVSSEGRAVNNAEQLYNSLSRRIKSRFMDGGQIPGKLFLLSSKRAKSDFTEKAVRDDAYDDSVFVRDHTMWEVKPGVYMNSKMFRVLVGNDIVKSRIMADNDELTKAEIDSGCYYIEVPDEFRSEFENELEGSLRDLAGIATDAINPFIGKREAIVKAVDRKREHPFTTYEWVAGTDGKFIWDKLCTRLQDGEVRPILNPEARRHIAIDTSLTGDSTGFAMGHVSGTKKVSRKDDEGGIITEELPNVVIDFVLRINPPKGEEIQLRDVRQLVYQLAEHGGFPISMVTLDGFQSADSRQQFIRKGFPSEIISVDKSPDPYLALKHALYDERISFYQYDPLVEELKALEWNAVKKKVDHPDGGRKDVADAVAAVCYTVQGLHNASARNIINSLPMPMPMKGGHQGDGGSEELPAEEAGMYRSLIQVSGDRRPMTLRGFLGEARYHDDD